MSSYLAIYIYSIPDDPANERARELAGRLEGVKLVQVHCPPSARQAYRFPFLKDERGARYFGVDEIEEYVSRRLQAAVS